MKEEQKHTTDTELFLRRKENSKPEPLSFFACAKKLGLAKLLRILFIKSKAPRILLTNFLLTYNLRAGVSLLVHLLEIIRKDPKSALSLKTLLDESNFPFREEAVRTGLLVGLFTSIYKAVLYFLGKINFYRHLMARKIDVAVVENANGSGSDESNSLQAKLRDNHVKRERWHGAAAGFVAGFSLLVMDESWHRSLALYMATRLAQCIYTFNRDNGYFHFWGSQWAHGDSLMFAMASAQLLYAYVMRPETLPRSYYRFLIKQGPIDEPVLDVVRSSCRGAALNVRKLLEFVLKKANGDSTIVKNALPYLFSVNDSLIDKSGVDLSSVDSILQKLPLRDSIKLIPLQILHPYTRNSYLHTFKAFTRVAKLIFPVYLALALVPATVLRHRHFLKAPLSVVVKSMLSAVRSTVFLSLFCSSYQAVVVVQRWMVEYGFREKISSLSSAAEIAKVPVKDNKFIYWVAGFIASGSLLLEKKGRRSELALYALPRAVDSLFLIMIDRKLMFSLPNGEILLFCCSMGGIMYFYENHFDLLSPLLAKLLGRFLNNDIVFKGHQRLEDFDAFDELEVLSEDSKDDNMTRNDSNPSFTGSIVVPM